MANKKAIFNNATSKTRYSKGALYSLRELRTVEKALMRAGYKVSDDQNGMGCIIYNRPCGDEEVGRPDNVLIFLDSLGCHPDQSGLMMFDRNGKAAMSTVWDYAKNARIAAATNPVSRLFAKMF